MRLAWAVAVLASDSGLDSRSVSSRRAVAPETSRFQVRSQYPAHGRFIGRGLLFGKTERERQPVLLRIVEVPGFEQSRTRQRQAVQSRNAEEKTEAMAVPAHHGLNRKIELRLPRHLHFVLQGLACSLELVLDLRRRPLLVRFVVLRRNFLVGSDAPPGPRHVRADVRHSDVPVAAGACVAPHVAASVGAAERGDHQQQAEQTHR